MSARWLQTIVIHFCLVLTGAPLVAQLDQDNDQQSDIWEIRFAAAGLAGGGDADGDGWSNASESTAGTDPHSPADRPMLEIHPATAGAIKLLWPGKPGKRHRLLGGPDLTPASWPVLSEFGGENGMMEQSIDTAGHSRWFFRVQTLDTDTDNDGLFDWEELQLGFDPANNHTGRHDTADLARVQAGLAAASVVTVAAIDPLMREDWPDGGVVAVRRTGGLHPITVSLSFGGTAVRDVDYSANVNGNVISFPLGAREVWVELAASDDLDAEPDEVVSVTVLPGSGYGLGAATVAQVTIQNETALPGAEETARFLIQAAYGPNQDSTGDSDDIPENVEEVMGIGFDAWIDDQLTRPLGYISPYTDWLVTNGNGIQLYGNYKVQSWWARAMGAPKLRPNSPAPQAPDPLRQRMAFALSQILVTSDRPEALGPDQRGMANYYDLFVEHAFGNYKDLLLDVALHPVMGVYLSHLGNQKANPALNLHPDENFAREIMQLFTIGLWQLNQDGTRQTYPEEHLLAGQFIPTYTNDDITELARVFTGLTWGDSLNFNANNLTNGDRLQPMKMWDAFHDCEAKTLLSGLVLPARTASAGSTGTAGMADVEAAVENLFQHQNTGPFVSRLLIQRFVTSNPSHEYIGRVAAKFNDNGSGTRGDLKAVLRAILMDPEARDPAMMELPDWGKMREPVLRVVNLATAFNASSPSGHYPLDQFALDHLQDPMNSPSVFNFYLPDHRPAGVMAAMEITGPEFQIINASSAITGANYFFNAIGNNSLHRWGNANPNYVVSLNLVPEMSLILPPEYHNENTPSVANLLPIDPLLRRLDLALLGGTMSPRMHQDIREAVDRVKPPGSSWLWHRERLRLAITLIVTSAEYNVLR